MIGSSITNHHQRGKSMAERFPGSTVLREVALEFAELNL